MVLGNRNTFNKLCCLQNTVHRYLVQVKSVASCESLKLNPDKTWLHYKRFSHTREFTLSLLCHNNVCYVLQASYIQILNLMWNMLHTINDQWKLCGNYFLSWEESAQMFDRFLSARSRTHPQKVKYCVFFVQLNLQKLNSRGSLFHKLPSSTCWFWNGPLQLAYIRLVAFRATFKCYVYQLLAYMIQKHIEQGFLYQQCDSTEQTPRTKGQKICPDKLQKHNLQYVHIHKLLYIYLVWRFPST